MYKEFICQAKLIEIMKINGLKMRYYWFSNFIFNMILYSITIVVFVIFGGCYLGLTLFTETSYILQVKYNNNSSLFISVGD